MSGAEIVIAGPSSPITLAAPADPMLTLIERVVLDPTADMGKLERMLEMKKEVEAEASRRSYNVAMAACQGELPAIIARANNDHTRSKYATLADIYAAAKPIATKHGFSFSTFPAPTEKAGHLGVQWVLRHADGHTEEGFAEIPLDDKGINGTTNKTGTHAFGSSNSYARRYLFCMIFDIAITREDDDGNTGGGKEPPKTISAEQYQKIRDFAARIGVDTALIEKAEGVASLPELPLTSFARVMRNLTKDEARQAEAAKADEETMTANLTETP